MAQPAPYKVIYRSGPGPARADYKTVWDAASEDLSRAKLAVTGYTDEEEYRRTGEQTVAMLRRTVGIGSDEVILEIGAGVGRVGAVLAPLCKRWIGTDVSANMLRHAADRLAALGNVDLVTTNGWDLNEIPSESVDVAYCTVVFMHLDEWDRFNYVREGFRILRPGGRMYVDNFNLLGDEGWQFFVQHADNLHPLDRPPNISKSSTPEELRTYFERAGFADVHVDGSEWWVVGYGTKPD